MTKRIQIVLLIGIAATEHQITVQCYVKGLQHSKVAVYHESRIDFNSWIHAPVFEPCNRMRPHSQAKDFSGLDLLPCCSKQLKVICKLPTKEDKRPAMPDKIQFERCKMCQKFCLHPTNIEQRLEHKRSCVQNQTKAKELYAAVARSAGKTCGICMEVILEKTGRERRFGILPNCNHIFCLECIRKWRQERQFVEEITRSCPECRVCSDFVCPSTFWVDDKEEKQKLIDGYLGILATIDCKYFKQGQGVCRFGNKCFYRHALPNGLVVDVGPPRNAQQSREPSGGSSIYAMSFDYIDFISQEEENDDANQ